MKARLNYLGICGLVVAGIIHIVIVLLIPKIGERDAARQVMENAPTERFIPVTGNPKINIADADPFFLVSVCKFELNDHGVMVNGDKSDNFWSASVYNEHGQIIYSLNDRTAIGNQLNVLIVNPIQMAAIRQLQPDELETAIVVETQIKQGFILLRSLFRDQTQIPQSKAFVRSAKCTPYQSETKVLTEPVSE